MSKPTNLASRAICCLCGSVRKVDGRTRLDDPYDEARTTTLACEHCDTPTPHARIGGRRPRNHVTSSRTSNAEIARRKVAAFVDRLTRDFGVEVHQRRQHRKDRRKGFAGFYGYDDSKGRWRIELDPNLPPAAQLELAREMWRRIANDDHDADWDVRKLGVVIAPTSEMWASAGHDLWVDVLDGLDLERERLLAHLRVKAGVEVDHLPNAAVVTVDDVADDAAQRAAALLRELGEQQ